MPSVQRALLLSGVLQGTPEASVLTAGIVLPRLVSSDVIDEGDRSG